MQFEERAIHVRATNQTAVRQQRASLPRPVSFLQTAMSCFLLCPLYKVGLLFSTPCVSSLESLTASCGSTLVSPLRTPVGIIPMVSVSEPQMLATVVNRNCYFGKPISLVDHMAKMKTVSQVKQHCVFVSCFFGFCFFFLLCASIHSALA